MTVARERSARCQVTRPPHVIAAQREPPVLHVAMGANNQMVDATPFDAFVSSF
jgi:hypothetical protein